MSTVTVNWPIIERVALRMAEGGLRSCLTEGERIMKDVVLNQPGTGRVYRRGGVERRASAPGDAPSPDLNNLRTNTNADLNFKYEGGDVVGWIVAATPYAAALNQGTERMAARPIFNQLESTYRPDLARAFYTGAMRRDPS